MKNNKIIEIFNAEQPKVLPLDECTIKFSVHGEKWASYEEYVSQKKKNGQPYMKDKVLWEELHLTGMNYNKFNNLTSQPIKIMDETTMNAPDGRALVNRNFGEAIQALKKGSRVAREGWNGKGMFLFLLPAGTVPTKAIHDPALREVIETELGTDTFEALGSIRMFTADKKILTGWLASQTDMLAEDWMIYE
jgi:hypothetical protein